MPVTALTSVVLPAPLGPISANKEPRSTATVMESHALHTAELHGQVLD